MIYYYYSYYIKAILNSVMTRRLEEILHKTGMFSSHLMLYSDQHKSSGKKVKLPSTFFKHFSLLG